MSVRTLVVWFPGLEPESLESVVRALERFSPRVELRRPDECALPTRGPSRYFGGDSSLVEKVASAVAVAIGERRAFPELCSSERRWGVGIADGRFAASLAARLGEVVREGGSAAFLSGFPVSVLGRPELADLLERLGIRTLGQLASLPETDVANRFGPEGHMCLRLARGSDDSVLDLHEPLPDLAVSMELDPPVDRVDRIAFAAKTLCDELFERVRDLGLACRGARVEVETEYGERMSRIWSSESPFTPEALAERVRWQIEGWAANHTRPSSEAAEGTRDSDGADHAGGVQDAPASAVALLRIVPEELARGARDQPGFWGESAEVAEKVSRALARVQGMLGQDSVVTALVQGGRGPLDRVRLRPWGDRRRGGSGRPKSLARGTGERPDAGAPWPGKLPGPAPAVVHPEPLKALVVDDEGNPVGVTGRGAVTGRPASLSIEGGPWQELAGWAGPWPATEVWWRPSACRRRARLQVLAVAGGAYLLSLENGTWGVEGAYS